MYEYMFKLAGRLKVMNMSVGISFMIISIFVATENEIGNAV